MGWSDLSNSWKGVVFGVSTSVVLFIFAFVVLVYSFGFSISLLGPLLVLAVVKLIWGFTAGYFLGGIFGKPFVKN